MAALKPRTGDGPLEFERDGKSHALRIPIDGGGRMVLEFSLSEAEELKTVLERTLSATAVQ